MGCQDRASQPVPVPSPKAKGQGSAGAIVQLHGAGDGLRLARIGPMTLVQYHWRRD